MKRLPTTLVAAAFIVPAHAVIILDSTYKEEGYAASEALAAEPQFAANFALCDAEGEGCGNASGTWIGNDEVNGYILTAAHAFDGDDFANRWAYRSRDGRYYRAESVIVHPNYVRVEAANQETAYSLGFDVAIVTLSEPVEGAGERVGAEPAGPLVCAIPLKRSATRVSAASHVDGSSAPPLLRRTSGVVRRCGLLT